MESNKESKKELFFYLGILSILILIIVCNNVFWKFGKQDKTRDIQQNNTTYLESNNVIYNVPYEEQWLD